MWHSNRHYRCQQLLFWQILTSPVTRTHWPGLLFTKPLHWRLNDQDGVSNHQPRGCLLNHLFGRRSKGTSKLRVTGLWAGNSPGTVNSPHKGPVTRKMFPFDDVIMRYDGISSVCPGLFLISHTAPLCDRNAHMYAHFYCKNVHRGILWNNEVSQ